MDWLVYGLIGWAAGDLIGIISILIAGKDTRGRVGVTIILLIIFACVMLGMKPFRGVTL